MKESTIPFLFFDKGLFINYVIHLGVRGGSISTSVEENTAIEPLNDCNIASDSFRVDFN